MSDVKSQPNPATPGRPAMDAAPDRSMEEIIASISRIIAEDGRPSDPRASDPRASGAARRVPPGPTTGILELTDAIADDGSVQRLAPAAGPSVGADPGRDAMAAGTVPDAAPAPPQPSAATGNPSFPPTARSERILSTATSEATASAFARLGAVSRERRAAADLPIGAPARTLEDVVRESLQPLLQAWLEAHLPALVERLVREEIARVAAEAGLR
ncbi:MAG TPA: DUF2497 domain-containing protein [Stellaceae bacterium]|nr:DUF2497 domain-containing protein [Stellaceae bacterium]